MDVLISQTNNQIFLINHKKIEQLEPNKLSLYMITSSQQTYTSI